MSAESHRYHPLWRHVESSNQLRCQAEPFGAKGDEVRPNATFLRRTSNA